MSKFQRASAQIVSPFLKCKKGDIAMILTGPYAGQVVDVVKYYSMIDMSSGVILIDAWEIRHPSDPRGTRYFKEDKYLLPIRSGDLDETEADGIGRKERDAREVQHG